jgi:hypothetical protein
MMLFDLQGDPAEQHDIAEKNSDRVNQLKDIYDRLTE